MQGTGGFCEVTIIGWLVLGIVAGWLAGMIMRGGGFGLIGDLVMGVIGAFVCGFLWSVITHEDVMMGFNLPSLLIAVLGAIVVIGISRMFTGRRVTT
jgi:uncharacterized membrane protein YeaQ/YmgE (transglycosylase-associated protein family)